MGSLYSEGGRSSTETWTTPRVPPRLADDEVHLWRCRLDRSDREVRELAGVLSSDEIDRAARPYHERGRRHAVVTRGFLRRVLSEYVGRPAPELAFVYGARGKPTLLHSPGDGAVCFNLAHSDGIVVLAVTRGRHLGADVERIRPIPEHARIAARFFSPAENRELIAHWAADPIRGFFTCWTRKEAYIKATGDGFSQPLAGFDVELSPGEPARLLRVEHDAREIDRWTFASFEPAPQYLGVVAVEGAAWRLMRWTFEVDAEP